MQRFFSRVWFLLVFLTVVSTGDLKAQSTNDQYAYISITPKFFSKKLKVEVDLGETPDQLERGERFSKELTNKKSHASILNQMVENGFELIETLEFSSSLAGYGGTARIVFIMREAK